MSSNRSLSELARQIEENQATLIRALPDGGMANVANSLALLTDSCLQFLALKGKLRQQIADMEKQISSRDTAVRLLTLKLEAVIAERNKLCQQLSGHEARASGSDDLDSLMSCLGSLNDQFNGIEKAQQLGLSLAKTQVRLLELLKQQRQQVQDSRDILRDIVAEDNVLIAGLKHLKEEDDATG